MIKEILFFGNYPNPVDGNLNVFFRNLIYQLADMGIKCTVIDPVSITKYRSRVKKIPQKRIETTKNGAEVTIFSPRFISFSSKRIGAIDTHVWTVNAYRRAAIKQVKKHNLNFDATYGHFINIGGIPACVVGNKYDKPAFVANGESDLNPNTYNYNSKYGLTPFKTCAGVISVSSKNRDELSALKLVDDEIIKVFPNAIDNSLFKVLNKKECREKLNLPLDWIIVGFVGGFSERKGDKRLVEAAKDIKGVKLAFAGTGAEPPTGDNVIFCKSVPHDDIPVFLNACDVFVLPTLNEGCCNAIIEALACGLPVISSDLPFNDDILNDSNSIRVNPRSIDEIKLAILKLVNDIEYRKLLSVGALRTAEALKIEQRAQNILEYMRTVEMEENNAH